MLTLRKKQTQAFQAAAVARLEEELVAHVGRFTPFPYQYLGKATVLRVVRLGVARAREYNLTTRASVRLYIELMFMLGSDFDTDPQLPWATSILGDSTTSNELDRAGELFDRASDYVSIVAGPDAEYEVAALRRACKYRWDLVGTDEASTLESLRYIHPEKYNYVGDRCLHALARKGGAVGLRLGIPFRLGSPVLTALMFAFGHGCANDPQFPWIERTLASKDTYTPRKCMEHLQAEASAYLRLALATLNQGN